MTPSVIRIGARASRLSQRQVAEVMALVQQAHPGIAVESVPFVTSGDIRLDTPLPLMGDKGVFTAEIETALRAGEIDLAVHSLKDLPVEPPVGIAIGAVPGRADVRDVLLTRGDHTLDTLPAGATVGTSSHRRAAQLRLARPDLQTTSIRGNVETRIRKLMDPDGPYDAIVLARVGLDRLGIEYPVGAVLPIEVMLPAPGQAALAVQCRDEAGSLAWTSAIDDPESHFAILAERAFLSGLGGGCSAPVAAYAALTDSVMRLAGRVVSLDASTVIDVEIEAPCADRDHALEIGSQLAAEAMGKGAASIVAAVAS